MFTMELGLMYFQRQFITLYAESCACVVTLLPVLIVS